MPRNKCFPGANITFCYVLYPFVTYLLTLPHTLPFYVYKRGFSTNSYTTYGENLPYRNCATSAKPFKAYEKKDIYCRKLGFIINQYVFLIISETSHFLLKLMKLQEHNRSSKVAVQGLVFVANPLYI
jgi:hypothetical protein